MSEKCYSIVDGKQLDQDQINCIINDNRNNLVIASAGSGKTTTIIGKVKYLIKVKNIRPDEILCLSFTNKSAKELEERVEIELNTKIDVFTFHKLGINIINISYFKKEYLTENNYVIAKIIEVLLNNESFLADYISYFYNRKNAYFTFKNEYYKIIENANMFANYINLIKQERYTIDILNKKSTNKKYKIFMRIFTLIYNMYQKHLIDNNLIDFNDMINIASDLIKENKVKLYYKYIIIDEYQDMSLSRFLLIKEIYDKNNSELFCVGDDYQCIFSYAGSKLDYFINFEKYFGSFNLNIIKKTYRFNQMLADISSKFITANKKQFKKQINSFKNNNTKSLKIIELDALIKEMESLPSYSKIFFLGRYKHDLKIIEKNNLFNIENSNEIIIYFKRRIDLNIKFFTVHQSKGLEADYVFILNNKKGSSGFPSKKKDSKIMKIIHNRDYYLDEERRLYYVALTRAKVSTILLNDRNNESLFVKEIKRYLKRIKSS